MAAPTTTVLLPFLLLVAFSSYPVYAVTEEHGREGDLDDFEDQNEAITQIYRQVYNTIELDRDYGPNQPVAIFSADLTQELRLHTTFMLFDVGACAGTRVGTIRGSDLLATFVTVMLRIIQSQIRRGFGFGMVTASEDDTNLGMQGISAQFYYWVEGVGVVNPGGETPNTGEAKGPSDDDTNRHDELSFILATQCSGGPGCWSNTYLIMQDDGNLVLYLLDTWVPLWASNTQVYK